MCTETETINSIKRQPTEGEKIFANHLSDKGLVSKVYKELIQLKSKKINMILKWSEDKQTFFQARHTNGQQVHEKISTSLIIREIQVKTTMRYCLIPVSIAVINKTRDKKCWQEFGEKGSLVHHWWECKLMQHYGKEHRGSSEN